MSDDSLQSDMPADADGNAFYAQYPFSEAILHNLQDMTWFMWNYGNAFLIPLFFLITFQVTRLLYKILKDTADIDIIGWLYNYSF